MYTGLIALKRLVPRVAASLHANDAITISAVTCMEKLLGITDDMSLIFSRRNRSSDVSHLDFEGRFQEEHATLTNVDAIIQSTIYDEGKDSRLVSSFSSCNIPPQQKIRYIIVKAKKLRRVVTHLVSNAYKYCTSDGDICVTLTLDSTCFPERGSPNEPQWARFSMNISNSLSTDTDKVALALKLRKFLRPQYTTPTTLSPSLSSPPSFATLSVANSSSGQNGLGLEVVSLMLDNLGGKSYFHIEEDKINISFSIDAPLATEEDIQNFLSLSDGEMVCDMCTTFIIMRVAN